MIGGHLIYEVASFLSFLCIKPNFVDSLVIDVWDGFDCTRYTGPSDPSWFPDSLHQSALVPVRSNWRCASFLCPGDSIAPKECDRINEIYPAWSWPFPCQTKGPDPVVAGRFYHRYRWTEEELLVADGIEEFKEQYPSLESYWRSIILFGRNVASY